MERRHTPGPWLTEANSYGDEIEVYPQKNGPPPIGRWAEICTVKDCESQEEMEANAMLIAAAPDLLFYAKAVVNARRRFQMDPENNTKRCSLASAINALEMTIAKAEGRL